MGEALGRKLDFRFGGGLRCDTSLRSFYGGWLGGLLSLRSGMSLTALCGWVINRRLCCERRLEYFPWELWKTGADDSRLRHHYHYKLFFWTPALLRVYGCIIDNNETLAGAEAVHLDEDVKSSAVQPHSAELLQLPLSDANDNCHRCQIFSYVHGSLNDERQQA